MAEHYASGVWHVKQGNDEEFVGRWTEFLQWSRANYPSMVVANLLRDGGVPGRYMSFSEWTDEASRDAWKQDPEFKNRFGACVALCEDMHGADYDLAVSV
ncbi:antibiotic biosynthesis monooxygenase family protein [Pseudarthrobacter sp. O4]|uniref:antibiotic biosynthesis monooxygenase family protein n=1 Tax=Pseudarthrobacter sp. O4 TaxID=3418417 RepID=UPI003CE9DAB9